MEGKDEVSTIDLGRGIPRPDEDEYPVRGDHGNSEPEQAVLEVFW